MNRVMSARGSVLMEFVIVAPMLLLLIFGIIQFAYLFMAKQLTFYAAYSAARTALVYNIKDYTVENTDPAADPDSSDRFLPSSGPLYLAASTIMSWMNAGDGSSDFPFVPKGNADVWWQVRISGKERIVQVGKDQIPTVAVTVHYYCPLLIPLVGDMLAYVLARDTGSGSNGDSWEIFGWVPGSDSSVAMQHVTQTEDTPKKKIYHYNGVPVVHLQETCYMVKPYKTSTYARIPTGDLEYMRSLQ